MLFLEYSLTNPNKNAGPYIGRGAGGGSCPREEN